MALPPYGSLTSALGPGVSVIGFQIQVGDAAASPANFFNILNAIDFALPTKADTVDVTNFGDLWRRRIPTLLDMGDISFKVYWQMQEPSHHNGPDSTAFGLRYLLVNRLLRDYQAIYPDAVGSVDAFPAFVVDFSVTGSLAKVFEGAIKLSNSGQPSLC